MKALKVLYTDIDLIFFTNSDIKMCQLQVVCFIVCYTCNNDILYCMVLAAACTLSIEQEKMDGPVTSDCHMCHSNIHYHSAQRNRTVSNECSITVHACSIVCGVYYDCTYDIVFSGLG